MKSYIFCGIVVALMLPSIAESQGVVFSDVTAQAHLAGFVDARAAAWMDFNRDGYQDLLVGSEYGANRLHLNNGDGTFTNITIQACIPQRTGVWAVNFADIDNDGFEDIYMSTRAPDTISAGRNILLWNSGMGYYEDISDSSGANVWGGGVGACFAPFNKGATRVDLFAPNQYYPTQQYPNMLYNSGYGSFSDVTQLVGLHMLDWWDIPLAFDYDNDNKLELFCTKDYHGNSMYDQVAGYLFVDVSDSLHFQTPCGYGATAGDINNDGWFDLYITNWHDIYDNLFIYNGYGSYEDVTTDWHARGATWTSAAHFADFDNDGWLDLFVTGAGVGNKYYHNVNGIEYEDRTAQAHLTNFNYNWGAAVGDYDRDGFLDIYVPEYYNSGNGGMLYHNGGNNNNWVQFDLQGTNSNKDGIGAKLILDSPSFSQIRQAMAGSGFGSQNSLVQHFGIGQDSIINRLIVRWPSGGNDIYFDMPVNRYYLLEEGNVTSVEGEDIELFPADFDLANAWPNPFNGSTRIDIEIFKHTELKADIIDILGRVIKNLFDGSVDTQSLSLTWDGADNAGQSVSSGVYFCRVSNGNRCASAKLLLQK